MMMYGDILLGSPLIQKILYREAEERNVNGIESATQTSVCACPFVFRCHCDMVNHVGFFTCKDSAASCMCVFQRIAKPDQQDSVRLNAYLKQHGVSSCGAVVVPKPSPTNVERPSNPCFIAKCQFCGIENGLYCGGGKNESRPFHYMERLDEHRQIAVHLHTLRTWKPQNHVNPLLFDNAFAKCVNPLCSSLVVLNYADFFHGLDATTIVCAKHREHGDAGTDDDICALVMYMAKLMRSVNVRAMGLHVLPDPCSYMACHGEKRCEMGVDTHTARLNMKVYPVLNTGETKQMCERYHSLVSMESLLTDAPAEGTQATCERCEKVKNSIIGGCCGSTRTDGGRKFSFPCSKLSVDDVGRTVLVEYVDESEGHRRVSHIVDIALYQCMRCLKHKSMQRRFCYACLFRHSLTHDWSVPKIEYLV